jgi:hypothetical protein
MMEEMALSPRAEFKLGAPTPAPAAPEIIQSMTDMTARATGASQETIARLNFCWVN